ncbi:beta-propeller fold lactonase family protein [Acidothermaceae bacterium B102]|nr:beta-propeller fold lactonase family protein [Acidothermaceae bacterium B102]
MVRGVPYVRIVVAALALSACSASHVTVAALAAAESSVKAASATSAAPAATTPITGPTTSSAPVQAIAPTTTKPVVPHSDLGRLTLIHTISGAISPKSVASSGHGLVFAQNMMYRHSITVYGSDGHMVGTIPDSVTLSQFGITGHPGVSRGAPVEAVFSADGKYAYVSNYSMYGAGFGPEGHDVCTPASAARLGVSPSFVYRVNVATLKIDKVIQVDRVPKFVALTPDGTRLLVSNWCSYTEDVIDLTSWKVVKEIPVGAYPRGIAISPDSRTAYIAVMGSTHIAVLDLHTLTVKGTVTVGVSPRHIVISPDGHYVYATLNAGGGIVKVDTRSLQVVRRVATGTQPRSMAISHDGRSLYVVNYVSNTVTKVRSDDLAVLQRVSTGKNPIGISDDPVTGNIWVAIYTGQILVFQDR